MIASMEGAVVVAERLVGVDGAFGVDGVDGAAVVALKEQLM